MRVLLCRARADGEATARRLAGAGHEAVLAPVLAFVALHPPFPGPAEYGALLMTSAHAAEALADNAVQAWVGKPLYAVGAATAAAARARGFRDIRVSQGGDGAALAALVQLTLPAPAGIAYAAGRPRKPGLEDNLASKGYRIEPVEIYEAVEASAWDDAVLQPIRAGQIDAGLHYSRRSAELALRFAEAGGVGTAFAQLRHICISPDAAVPLAAAGLEKITIAASPSESSLLSALFAECSAQS